MEHCDMVNLKIPYEQITQQLAKSFEYIEFT